MKSPPFCAIINLLDYDTWKGAFFMGRKNPAKNINIGLLAHVDAGKTTLSEALLYTCGSIRKLGRVDHRNTALDTHKIERERGITVFSKQAQLRTDNMELCLLDTPGHADLTAETERTLDVIDYALLVISGTDGVQAHTETLWRLLDRHNVPTIIFATKMDLTGSDRQRILSDLRERLSEGCFDLSDNSQETREGIAMCDEELFEKFASGQDIADGDISRLILERKLFPVLYGSGLKLEGVQELVEFIEKYAVSPEYPEQFGARVYKIMRDARDRRLSCMKITGGTLHNRDSVNGQTVTELRVYSGANYETVQEVRAGSIVAVQGLDDTYAGQGRRHAAGYGSGHVLQHRSARGYGRACCLQAAQAARGRGSSAEDRVERASA